MEKLESLRKEIDNIDDKIAELFVLRMDRVEKIADEKAKLNKQIADANREDEILQRLKDKVPQKLSEYFAEFYEKIFKISKEFQMETAKK